MRLACFAFAAATCAAGCFTPLVHPLRATDGPLGELSLGAGPVAGRNGSCGNPMGCTDTPPDGSGMVTGNMFVPQFSLGWGHVLWDHVGLMGGVYFPSWENQKDADVWAGLAAWTFFTFQTDYFSYGLGPELGFGGAAMTVGGEVRSSPGPWPLALGAYARWFYPFTATHEEFDNRSRTSEWGVRFRVGPFYVQYARYMQAEGVMYWLLFETASYAQGLDNVSIGVSIDLDSARALCRISGDDCD